MIAREGFCSARSSDSASTTRGSMRPKWRSEIWATVRAMAASSACPALTGGRGFRGGVFSFGGGLGGGCFDIFRRHQNPQAAGQHPVMERSLHAVDFAVVGDLQTV